MKLVAIVPCVLMISILSAGCNLAGPYSVRQGRPNYNDAIHETAKEQALLNLIRVNYQETTLFLDVSEVDATLQFQGQATSTLNFPQAFMKGMAGIFFPGHDYSMGGSLQYQESPTIRYQPLTGAALIGQLSSPITVDSIASLYDSDWRLGPLLDLAADRIATRAKDNFPALNALMELDSYNAIVLAATKSPLSLSPGGSGPPPSPPASGLIVVQVPSGGGGASGSPSPNDTLVIYLEPERVIPHPGETSDQAKSAVGKLWARLLRIYAGTQPFAVPSDQSFRDLENGTSFNVPRSIELRIAPVDPFKRVQFASVPKDVFDASAVTDFAPIMRTHSALGVLRSATQEEPRIEIVTPNDVSSEPWKSAADLTNAYYYIVHREGTKTHIAINQRIAPEPEFTSSLDFRPGQDPAATERERERAHARRYVLLISSDQSAPDTAFVSTHFDVLVRNASGVAVRQRRYFYIDGRDEISKRNFALIVHFLTIQAIPSQTPPLTPSLTVGGKGS